MVNVCFNWRLCYFSCREIGPIIDLVLLYLEVASIEYIFSFSKKENSPMIGDHFSGSLNFLFKHVSSDNYSAFISSCVNKPKYIYKDTNEVTLNHIFNFRLAPMHTDVKNKLEQRNILRSNMSRARFMG